MSFRREVPLPMTCKELKAGGNCSLRLCLPSLSFTHLCARFILGDNPGDSVEFTLEAEVSPGDFLIPFGTAVTVSDNICLPAPLCSSSWHLVSAHSLFLPVFWGRCLHDRGGRGGPELCSPNEWETRTHQMPLPPSYSNSSKNVWHIPMVSKAGFCPVWFLSIHK